MNKDKEKLLNKYINDLLDVYIESTVLFYNLNKIDMENKKISIAPITIGAIFKNLIMALNIMFKNEEPSKERDDLLQELKNSINHEIDKILMSKSNG